MRMWMVDPKKMCLQHLLGEHVECHMFVGTINKGTKVDGYISNDLLQIQSLRERHDRIAEELKKRNFETHGIIKNHRTLLKDFNVNYCKHIKIDKDRNEKELRRRCEECRRRMNEGY